MSAWERLSAGVPEVRQQRCWLSFSADSRIGDQTGSMDDIFSKLAKYLNDEKQMREKIQSALMYPSLVFSVLILGMVALFVFVFPRIKETFSTDTLDLVFFRFQTMMSIFMVPIVLIILFSIFIGFASKSSGDMRIVADLLKLKIPIIGKIISIRSTLNIMFSLEVLTACGFPVEAAIEESSKIVSNTVLDKSLNKIRKAIIGGEKLSLSFKNEKVFPKRISQWIVVGEASGSVIKVFSQLRTYYQGELDKITFLIMLLVEPVLIVFIGIFMILFVLLFIVPIFSIFGAVI